MPTPASEAEPGSMPVDGVHNTGLASRLDLVGRFCAPRASRFALLPAVSSQIGLWKVLPSEVTNCVVVAAIHRGANAVDLPVSSYSRSKINSHVSNELFALSRELCWLQAARLDRPTAMNSC